MGLDNQFKVCYNCVKEEIEVTTFGEAEKQFIRYTVCGRPQSMGETLMCGFYDFCKGCKKRFLCATERK